MTFPSSREGPPIRAVLLDLDNTLLDRDLGVDRFATELHRSRPLVRATHSEDEAVDFVRSLDTRPLEGAGQRSRGDVLTDLMRQWPGLFRDLDEAMSYYLRTLPRLLVLEPVTRDLLSDLRGRGIPVAIVTNGKVEMQRSKVRESGLDGLVDAVVIPDELGAAKPDRAIFEHALAGIGADPTTTLFAGDDPDKDIVGARALGMTTAWVHRGRQWPLGDPIPDYVIGHVSELSDILLR